MTRLWQESAEAELADAAVFYAQHASAAIAERFLLEYERVRDLVIGTQRLGQLGDLGFRVFHLDRLPYTLVYEEDVPLGPQIYAVAHQRRHPGYWRGRVQRTRGRPVMPHPRLEPTTVPA